LKTSKNMTAFFLIFAMILTLVPMNSANAATIKDIKIISNTKVTVQQAEKWAKSKGASEAFIDLAELYWEYAEDHGEVNPAIAYVQSAKETAYGNFGGVLDETYNNPCGMKTSQGGDDYDPNAHQRFDTWDDGVKAHLDHLALYAGADGYPRKNTEDPRHFATIKGKASTVNSLGGNWAQSSTYGEEVNKLYRNLLDYSGVDITEDEEIEDTTSSDKNDSDNSTNSDPNDSNNSTNSESNAKPNFNVTIPTGVTATKPVAKPENEGTNISSSIGWKKENGNWYYYKDNGAKATGWIKPGNNWYYLYSSGAMATGWMRIGNTWYYLKPSGEMQIGWLKDGATWYYLEGNGAMSTGMKLINGKQYFLDTSGAMRTSWFKISGNWYYFSGNGDMLTGWIKPDGNWYYLYDNGTMAIGWAKVNDTWYYLNGNGAMATGWIQYDSNYYYLTSSGALAVNTVVDGWKIGSDGKRGDKVSSSGPSSSKVIVVDAGHNYGGDDGAYATHGGITYCERDLNMQVAVKLQAKLEAKGYKVLMTRNPSDRETVPVTQSLTNWVNMANNFGADFFVSIHHNSAGAASANGVEVYYSSKAQDASFGGASSSSKVSVSRSLASSIVNSISSQTGAYNRGAKDNSFFVCRNTKMPSVLVEVGFLTNQKEAENCANPSYQDKVATAIANSIASNI